MIKVIVITEKYEHVLLGMAHNIHLPSTKIQGKVQGMTFAGTGEFIFVTPKLVG